MTKSGKHCDKRRNCTFCAISSFDTMFSKSCLLQRRQKTSIWGKGLIEPTLSCFPSLARIPFLSHLAKADNFWKHCDSSYLSFRDNVQRFSLILPRCFKSRLLQMTLCQKQIGMWEIVDSLPYKIFAVIYFKYVLEKDYLIGHWLNNFEKKLKQESHDGPASLPWDMPAT